MKFVLKKSYQFPWPIKVKVPNPAQPGSFQVQQIDAEFRALPKDEFNKLLADIEALPESEQEGEQDRLLRSVVVGWDASSVADEDGNAVPFGPDSLAEMLQLPFFRIAAWEAYNKAMSGGASQGN